MLLLDYIKLKLRLNFTTEFDDELLLLANNALGSLIRHGCKYTTAITGTTNVADFGYSMQTNNMASEFIANFCELEMDGKEFWKSTLDNFEKRQHSLIYTLAYFFESEGE
jgi:hypothetical protein